jgi:hypothetical protein
MRSRAEIFDEAGRKRALADQAAASYGDAKRQKVEASVPQFSVPPLGPGPHTLAGVFTLTNNLGLQAFDVAQLPANLTAMVGVRTLASLDEKVLDLAVSVSFLSTNFGTEEGAILTMRRASGIVSLLSTLQGQPQPQQHNPP